MSLEDPILNRCRSCLKKFKALEDKYMIDTDKKRIFQELVGLELGNGFLCGINCFRPLQQFDKFRKNIRNIWKNNEEFLQAPEPPQATTSIKVKEETMETEFLITEIKAEPEDHSEPPIMNFPMIFPDPLQESFSPLLTLNPPPIIPFGPPAMPSDSLNAGYKCQYCDKKFAQKSFVIDHHRFEHSFRCHQCPSIFRYEISLIKHITSEHAKDNKIAQKAHRNFCNYNFICEFCQMKFRNDESLKRHIDVKHKSNSDVDTTKLVNQILLPKVNKGGRPKTVKNDEKKLENLEKSKNTRKNDKKILENSEKSVKIRKINKKIDEKPKPETKTLIKKPPEWNFCVSSENPKFDSSQRKTSKSTKQKKSELSGSPCLECGLLLSPELMSLHYRQYHDKSSSVFYTCDICGVEMKGKTDLIGHMTVKHLHGLNHCLFCKTDFNNRLALIDHIYKEHPDKEANICHICDKVFKTKPEIEKHKKVHKGNFKKETREILKKPKVEK